MDRWYAWVENKLYGPYLPEQLGEFIHSETKLCREGTEEWKAAKDYPELSFFLSGTPLEPPPNVGWLLRKANTSAVLGPFSKTKFLEMITAGEITVADFVKHTDWDEWENLRKTKLVGSGESLSADRQPVNPEDFRKVIAESSDQDLMREYKENYKLYARRERKILKEELLRRGLIKKTFGIF